jgi:hypothetical protein
MKTSMKTQRKNVKKTDKWQSVENCKLERLKMTQAYGPAGQAEAWAAGIRTRQADIGCAVALRPKRLGSRQRTRLAASRP